MKLIVFTLIISFLISGCSIESHSVNEDILKTPSVIFTASPTVETRITESTPTKFLEQVQQTEVKPTRAPTSTPIEILPTPIPELTYKDILVKVDYAPEICDLGCTHNEYKVNETDEPYFQEITNEENGVLAIWYPNKGWRSTQGWVDVVKELNPRYWDRFNLTKFDLVLDGERIEDPYLLTDGYGNVIGRNRLSYNGYYRFENKIERVTVGAIFEIIDEEGVFFTGDSGVGNTNEQGLSEAYKWLSYFDVKGKIIKCSYPANEEDVSQLEAKLSLPEIIGQVKFAKRFISGRPISVDNGRISGSKIVLFVSCGTGTYNKDVKVELP